MAKPNETVTIKVNGDPHPFDKPKITYEEVVNLAFPGTGGSNKTYIVKYSKGASGNEKVGLSPGDAVPVKDGMSFRVSPTGES
jgi:hypothetical protein